MQKIIVNVQTGEQTLVDLTAEEIASLPTPIPTRITSVSMRQARMALLQNGLLATVNTAVANWPGVEGDAARIEWEFSNIVERDRPLVISLGLALGLTEQQLDDLFTLANTL